MERTGPASSGVRPDDVVEILGRSGPFATVWLSTPLEIGSQDPLVPALNTVHGELASAGAPDELIDQIATAVEDHRHEGQGLVVVADSTQVCLVESLPEPPRAELRRWAALPSLSPVLEHRQAQIPYVVALLDRTGADLFAGTPERQERSVVAGGEDQPLRKSAPGGWSQRRYQQRAENTWEHNAGDVADELVRLVESTRAHLVLVGGDVRARQLLDDALPAAVRALVREVPGGRARDGSEQLRATEIDRLVRTAVATETVELLHAFKRDAGQGRTAEGPADTIGALRQDQVDVLLVHDDPDDTDTVWTGPASEHLAIDPSELDAMGVDGPVEARMTDALIQSALRSGASVRVVPAATAPAEGVGAILRW